MAHAPRERGVALGDRAPHLFLSHSSKDSVWVSLLASHLNICGVDVWLDAWELRVGDDLHERISEAVAKSRFVAIVLTRHFNESKWIKGEVHQALSREKAEDRTLVLPLLAGEVPLPPVLSSKKYLDFAHDYFGSLVRLVGLIHDRQTDSIETAIREIEPRDLAQSLTALEYDGYNPLVVVGTHTLEEIERAGGLRRGEIVHFQPQDILRNGKISGALRDLMKRILRSPPRGEE